MPTLAMFGQHGHIPRLGPRGKLDSRSALVRYMETVSLTHILVQHPNGRIARARLTDFHPIIASSDPTRTHLFALPTFQQRLSNRPDHVGPSTPAPVQLSHAKLYPDAEQWCQAYDIALDKIDAAQAIDWSTQPPRSIKPIPLTVAFSYKRDIHGEVSSRKARCALRGDLMRPGVHFDPDRTQCPTADKATVRILIAISAAHSWPMEHMDITNAYVHEPAMYTRPTYVRELPRSNGTYTHGNRIGRLVKNLWEGGGVVPPVMITFMPYLHT